MVGALDIWKRIKLKRTIKEYQCDPNTQIFFFL